MSGTVEHTNPKRKSSTLCNIVKTVILSLFLSILIEWLCITFLWPEEGHLHSKRVMQEEFSWFSAEFQYSLIYSYPVSLAENTITILYNWLFIKTGIQRWLNNPHQSEIGIWLFHYIRAYVESTLYVIITFVIRLLIIILTSPLFVLAAIVGFIDGLVQRDIRRFGVGRESAFKYHHAKRAIFPTMILAWIIYLSIPFSIHPNIILIPAALLFGLTIALTSANFKKYL
ncbi:TIGR03747 family integrating conjugative element membrane protein [Pasteurella oralis]|uniref:TIGR03747 family integrating conjugative element membrane protein n=1 Tax=Pasteurella oralis TaxID=1071947 RepID=UPI000C797350|nr:TIGR03747 family integrating conjugative element membrane protein [Pasteurella oralis]